MAIEQSLRRDQESRGADSALKGSAFKEALLQRMQAARASAATVTSIRPPPERSKMTPSGVFLFFPAKNTFLENKSLLWPRILPQAFVFRPKTGLWIPLRRYFAECSVWKLEQSILEIG